MTLNQAITNATNGLDTLENNMNNPGPGGEAYDLSPTPRIGRNAVMLMRWRDALPRRNKLLLGTAAAVFVGMIALKLWTRSQRSSAPRIR